ncbi:unnamed protein product, partial [Dracunculus medinensis]|uniref:CX domain-containing protein n=1 Tax=Dracunculus medinensis TaxID=318479 RepID=A0A0N4U1X8_DRAME
KFGSVLRSNQFKNAIVGAASNTATYIIAVINNQLFRWNNRHYYWDSRYYRGMGSGSHMCRMPIDSTDSQLGNVYFEDGTSRPREIVWSCSYYEYCCGYECCSRGSSSFWGIGLGYVIVCILFFIHLLL